MLINPSSGEPPAVPWAQRPLTAAVGARQRFSDLRYADFYWSGTRWLQAGGSGMILAELNADVLFSGTTELVVLQAALPAGLLGDGAILRFSYDGGKTGTAENPTFRMRVGNAGTIADNQVKLSTALLQGSSNAGATLHELIRTSNTSMAARGANNIVNASSMSNVTGAGYALPVTTGNLDSSINYASLTLQSTGTADQITLKRGARIELVSLGG